MKLGGTPGEGDSLMKLGGGWSGPTGFLPMHIIVMTKVRLRTPAARAPRPRIGTRGETRAQRKEREIIRIYRGAKNNKGKSITT